MTESRTQSYHVVDEGALHKYRTEIPNTVIRGIQGRELSLPARWLYVYLKSVAGDRGACWQNTTTLANGARLGRGTITNAKQELINAGLIAVEVKGQRYHDTDRIRILDIWEAIMREFVSFSCSPGEQPLDESTLGKSTPSSDVVHQVNAVVHEVNNGCSPGELEEDPIRIRKGDLSASKTNLDKAKSPGFERFWQAYPVKKGKGHAWAAWRKLKLEPVADAICASVLTHQAQDPQWQKGYVPNPSTYLNGSCWEDEFPTASGASTPPKRRGLIL
jgi:hypothetical protein